VDDILALVTEKGYLVTHLLETYVHVDHLTALNYMQKQLENSTWKRPKSCIGKRIKDA
jgi:glyoxylase-like metal-dependent hydrolase (beta-lactamase superfamily II)